MTERDLELGTWQNVFLIDIKSSWCVLKFETGVIYQSLKTIYRPINTHLLCYVSIYSTEGFTAVKNSLVSKVRCQGTVQMVPPWQTDILGQQKGFTSHGPFHLIHHKTQAATLFAKII